MHTWMAKTVLTKGGRGTAHHWPHDAAQWQNNGLLPILSWNFTKGKRFCFLLKLKKKTKQTNLRVLQINTFSSVLF